MIFITLWRGFIFFQFKTSEENPPFGLIFNFFWCLPFSLRWLKQWHCCPSSHQAPHIMSWPCEFCHWFQWGCPLGHCLHIKNWHMGPQELLLLMADMGLCYLALGVVRIELPTEVGFSVLGLRQPPQATGLGGKASVHTVSAYVSELKPFVPCLQWQEVSYWGLDCM